MFANKPEQDDTTQRGVIVSGVAGTTFGVTKATTETTAYEVDTAYEQPSIDIDTTPKTFVDTDTYVDDESSEESSDEEDIATVTKPEKKKLDRSWKWTPLPHHVALSCGGKSAQNLIPFWIGIILGLALLAIWICATIWYWCKQLIYNYNDIINNMKKIDDFAEGGDYPQFKFSSVSYATTPFKMILRCIIDSITSWFNYGAGEAFGTCCLGKKDAKTDYDAAKDAKVLAVVAAKDAEEARELQRQADLKNVTEKDDTSNEKMASVVFTSNVGSNHLSSFSPSGTEPSSGQLPSTNTKGKKCCGMGKANKAT